VLVKFYECCPLSFFKFADYVGFDDGDGVVGFDGGFYDSFMAS